MRPSLWDFVTTALGNKYGILGIVIMVVTIIFCYMFLNFLFCIGL